MRIAASVASARARRSNDASESSASRFRAKSAPRQEHHELRAQDEPDEPSPPSAAAVGASLSETTRALFRGTPRWTTPGSSRLRLRARRLPVARDDGKPLCVERDSAWTISETSGVGSKTKRWLRDERRDDLSRAVRRFARSGRKKVRRGRVVARVVSAARARDVPFRARARGRASGTARPSRGSARRRTTRRARAARRGWRRRRRR